MIEKLLPDFSKYNQNPESMGQLGDYIGGLWGTILTLLTIVILLISWYQSRRIDQRNRVFSIFSEMVRNHENTLTSMRRYDDEGRAVFTTLILDLKSILKIILQAQQSFGVKLSEQERCALGYLILMSGPSAFNDESLSRFNSDFINSVKINMQLRNEKSLPYGPYYEALSHYFRNLYIIHKFIDKSHLSKVEKEDLAKIIRSRLSVNEQFALAMNVKSKFGRMWEMEGIMQRYQPIKNIPKGYFFSDSKSLTNLYPYIEFEWETEENPVLESRHYIIFGVGVTITRRSHVFPVKSIISAVALSYLRLIIKLFT